MVTKKRISIALRFVVSFGLLVLLVWIMRNDIGEIANILKGSNKLFFGLGLSIMVLLTIPISYRLKLLMKGQKILLSMKDVIYLTFIGFFFNNFLPTAVGGDIAKAYYASKKTNNKLASYAAVISDRLMGFLSILSIAIVGLIFMGKSLNNKIIYAVCAVFLFLIVLILFLFSKNIVNTSPPAAGSGSIINKIKGKLYKLYSAINLYRNKPVLLAKIFLLSMFMQTCTIVSIYFFILCLGGELPFLKLFFIVPLVWAISMLPSLNGLGVREGAFVYFLKGDIGPERAFAISLLWLGVIIMYGVIGGVLHLLYPVHPVKKKEKIHK
ncbi:lysylphosphatidylglycerol synthase transmembrane domain-containing protein [Candidatus Omnitrophota bacterium]